jgi:predicted aspartyl protease
MRGSRSDRLMAGGSLAGCILFAAHAVASTPPADAVPVISEVIVTAPEPKYVAPTLRDRIGRIWAPVYINGEGPFRLVLDTGASRSAVVERVASQLALPRAQDRPVILRGMTGSAEVPLVRAGQIEIGDLLAEDQQLLVVEDAFGGAEGVLATRSLQDRRILVEFRKDRIEISRSQGARAGPGFTVMPIRLIRGHVPYIQVRVGSVKAKAIIDTGAQHTIANLALRQALQRRRNPLDEFEEGVIGVTGDVQEGVNVSAPPIELGDVSVRNARVTFVDLYIFDYWKLLDEPAIMIGMDVWGVLDTMILDYRRRELQIRLLRGRG